MASSTHCTKQIDLWMGTVRIRGEAFVKPFCKEQPASLIRRDKGGSMALKWVDERSFLEH
jgi:hypothetical protein